MKRKKRRISLVGVAFVALLLLVLTFLVRLTLHRSPEVRLPELESTESGGDVISEAGQESIRRVEVTPGTVQLVIERLARPDRYSRTVTIERYWSDGSGQMMAQVRVTDGWTRVDVTGENEELRHAITGGGRSWVCFGSEGPVYSGAAALSADEEQGIPTYEDILLLDPAAIAVADYRTLNDENWVYVETSPDASGYAERYWIAVANGLLTAAERLQGETVTYRMTGLATETGDVGVEAFQLPDGEALFRPSTGERGETEG